jgi:hypothetical protein
MAALEGMVLEHLADRLFTPDCKIARKGLHTISHPELPKNGFRAEAQCYFDGMKDELP